MSTIQTYMDCLQSLIQRTEQAKVAAANGEWDRLLVCLEERQGLMDRIDALPQTARPATDEQRSAASQELERLASLDKETTLLVDTALAGTREALQVHEVARQTVSAYKKSTHFKPPSFTAKFVDTQR